MWKRSLFLLILFLAVACNTPKETPITTIPPLVTDEEAKLPNQTLEFVEDVTFDPETAVYYDLINNAMPLTTEEQEMLRQKRICDHRPTQLDTICRSLCLDL